MTLFNYLFVIWMFINVFISFFFLVFFVVQGRPRAGIMSELFQPQTTYKNNPKYLLSQPAYLNSLSCTMTFNTDTNESCKSKIINTINDIVASIDTLQYEMACLKSKRLLSSQNITYFKTIKFIGYNKFNISIPADIVMNIIQIGQLSQPWIWQDIYEMVVMFDKMKRDEQIRLIGGDYALNECQQFSQDMQRVYTTAYCDQTHCIPSVYVDQKLEFEQLADFKCYLLNGPTMNVEQAMAVASIHGRQQWEQYAMQPSGKEDIYTSENSFGVSIESGPLNPYPSSDSN